MSQHFGYGFQHIKTKIVIEENRWEWVQKPWNKRQSMKIFVFHVSVHHKWKYQWDEQNDFSETLCHLDESNPSTNGVGSQMGHGSRNQDCMHMCKAAFSCSEDRMATVTLENTIQWLYPGSPDRHGYHDFLLLGWLNIGVSSLGSLCSFPSSSLFFNSREWEIKVFVIVGSNSP